MTAKLVLVASYPKSGNTWARLVFERLKRGPSWNFSINEMATGFYGVSRRLLFDSVSPVNCSDLLLHEIENMLPKVLRYVAAASSGDLFLKVHDDMRRTQDGDWLYPPDCVRSVVYLVRHPFDVAISCAHHLGMTPENMVKLMADRKIVSHFERSLPLSLPQHVGSWTSNVSSWIGDSPYNVALVRYEDLIADPLAGFASLARVAGFDVPPSEIASAVEVTRFDALRREEADYGFRERPPTSAQFFRAGKARSWEGALSPELREQILKDHGTIMKQLGYTAEGDVQPLHLSYFPPGSPARVSTPSL